MALRESKKPQLITTIKYILSKWDYTFKAVLSVSALSLSHIFNKREALKVETETLCETHTSEKINFLEKVAFSDDSTISLVMRCAYLRLENALKRLLRGLKFACALEECCASAESKYRNFVLFPSQVKIENLADLPHILFTYGLRIHAQTVLRDDEKSIYRKEFCEDLLVCDQKTSSLLYELVYLASFPVLPPCIMSDLKASKIPESQHVNLDLTAPGVDSYQRIKDDGDARICIACKLNSLSIGHVDITEQEKRTICRCVISDPNVGKEDSELPYLEAAVVAAATIQIRLAVLSTSELTKQRLVYFRRKWNKFSEAMNLAHVPG